MSSYRGRSHPRAREDLQSREPRERHRSRLHGIYFARVTDINDPVKQGRIKVRFHWLEDEDEAEMESGWLTRCVPFVGPTNMNRKRLFGMNWPLPEVGSLVVIGFNGGDVHDGAYFGQPEYHEDDVGAPPTAKDDHIDWALRMELQNGFLFGIDTEGDVTLIVPGNLRVKVLGGSFLSSRTILTLWGVTTRVVGRAMNRLIGAKVETGNYKTPEEEAELTEMDIDAMSSPPGYRDPGIGKIPDLGD